MYYDAKIRSLRNSAFVDHMCDHSIIKEASGTSCIKKMQDCSMIRQLFEDASVKEVSDDALVIMEGKILAAKYMELEIFEKM